MAIEAVYLPAEIADLLTDLHSVAYELGQVIDLCQLALRMSKDSNFIAQHVDGVVKGAVVSYFKCFGSQKRTALSHADAAEFGLAELHETYKELRDKYVSHCVAPLDEGRIEAHVEFQNGEAVRLVRSSYHRSAVLCGPKHAEDLIKLASAAEDLVLGRIKTERANVAIQLVGMPEAALTAASNGMEHHYSDWESALKKKR